MKKISLALLIISNASLHSAEKKVEYVSISIAKKHPKKVAAGLLLTASGGSIAYSPACQDGYFKNTNLRLTDVGLSLGAVGITLLGYTVYQHFYNNDDQEVMTTTSIDTSLINKLATEEPVCKKPALKETT